MKSGGTHDASVAILCEGADDGTWAEYGTLGPIFAQRNRHNGVNIEQKEIISFDRAIAALRAPNFVASTWLRL